MRRIVVAMGAGALALAGPVQGQDLVAFTFSETRVLEAACIDAGLDCLRLGRFDMFMDEFTSRKWPLVVIEWYFDLEPAEKERLLPALAEHIDRGGRLLLVYTNLDEWPELQELVGVRTTGDVTWVRGRDIWSVEPPHATWVASSGNPLTGDEKYWDDNGDFLDPGAGGYVLAAWDLPGGRPAMVLTQGNRVIVNGFDLDAFEQDGIERKVAAQMNWLLKCHPDVDGDGELTFIDFLEFQMLFVTGDPTADFSFDGRLDFFDFLEFQNQFAAGCP